MEFLIAVLVGSIAVLVPLVGYALINDRDE